MTGVDASDNGGYGAAATTTNGSVTIDPSTFNSNDRIRRAGQCHRRMWPATGVEANDNGSFGAAVVTTVGSVSIDQGLFNSNTGFGLSANAADDVGAEPLKRNGQRRFRGLGRHVRRRHHAGSRRDSTPTPASA